MPLGVVELLFFWGPFCLYVRFVSACASNLYKKKKNHLLYFRLIKHVEPHWPLVFSSMCKYSHHTSSKLGVITSIIYCYHIVSESIAKKKNILLSILSTAPYSPAAFGSSCQQCAVLGYWGQGAMRNALNLFHVFVFTRSSVFLFRHISFFSSFLLSLFSSSIPSFVHSFPCLFLCSLLL